MKKIIYPDKAEWADMLRRPALHTETLRDTVKEVLDRVKSEGDRAVIEYEERFDKVKLDALAVTEAEMAEAEKDVPIELKAAIMLAQKNIHAFHAAQRFEGKKVQTVPGVTCWQKAVAIEKVGLYIPGGTAPLFSTVLMLATPAQIAGCKEIVLCTPPDKAGKIHPAILYAAKLAGVNKIFKAGGVQAIGAMAYGTESVPKVYKIFGPGNQYVTAAKQQVSLCDVAIDMPAGPSEVEVLADETANPVFVAADLLSQAEHGVDSQAMLVTTSEKLMEEVEYEVQRQLALLSRWEIAEKSLANSKLILVRDMDEAIALTNEYAPEHLIIETRDYEEQAERIVNAGSVFLGSLSPESAGDYASGTNHTLPTNGYAKAYGGVSLDTPGLTDGSWCALCGEVLTAQETIPAAHRYVNGVCTVCGARDPVSAPCPGGKACPGSRFTDMPPAGNWAHNAIDFTVAHKLFAGTSDTTFEPSARLTRAMIVMILYRLEGEPAAAAESAFTDVRSGAWYAGAIGWAAGSGIVNGVGGGRFDPNGLATREQTAAILYRYARFKGCDLDACGDLSAFADAGSVSAFALAPMTWAVGERLISGNAIGGRTLLDPQGVTTRAQFATIMMRYILNVVQPAPEP